MGKFFRPLKVGSINCFYPVLISFALGFFLNGEYCPVEQNLWSSSVLAIVVLVLQILFLFILRNPTMAALTVFTMVLWILFFGDFTGALSSLFARFTTPFFATTLSTIIYCIMGALMLWLFTRIFKSPFVSRYISTVATIFSLWLIGMEIIRIISCEQLANKTIESMHKQNGKIELSASAKPDIYYIILDAGARADTLRNVYGMHNIEFFDFLKKKGFYLGTASQSNYDRTKFSLSSSLNMNYINILSSLMPFESESNYLFCRLIQNAEATNSLKKLGYKIVNIRSGFPATEYNPQADINIGNIFCNPIFNVIASLLIRLTGMKDPTQLVSFIIRAKESWAFSHISEVQRIEGPKFVMVHILLPHPPFVFTADGSPLYDVLMVNIDRQNYLSKYGGQITYAFKQTQKMIDQLLTLSKDSLPIIIVQSDHGPQANIDKWPYSEAYLKERFGIVNAYFLPGVTKECLYNNISPVNSFRVVFNQYFQAHLPLLPDTSYYAPLNPPYYWMAWHDNANK